MPVAAFFESGRSIATFPRTHFEDHCRRLSPFIVMTANNR
jgi:hypothetical protein